jgi:hypothetical protein
MHTAMDYFLGDRDHSDIGINRQHDSIDDLIDCEDKVADSPIVEGSVLNGDDDYGYGDPLDELEDIVSDDPEDNDRGSEKDGALEGSS